MRSKSVRQGIVGVVAGLVLLGGGLYAAGWGNVPIGSRLPEVSLPDGRGKPVKVSARGAKAMIIVYVRADQARSQDAVREIITLHKKYVGKGVRTFAVATARHDGRDAVARLVRQLKVPFPVVVDVKGSFRGKGGLYVYPTTGVADGNGVLRYEYSGYRPDYAIEVERQVKAVLGIGPPPDQIEDLDRNAVSPEQRHEQRQNRMQKMMRRLELMRAQRRFSAARSMLEEKNLDMVLKLYVDWSNKLPEPTHPALASAVERVRSGHSDRAAEATLRKLSADSKVKHEALLWLGRALAQRKATAAEAAKVLKQCTGQPALRGQCEFELARLVAQKEPGRATSLCKAGFVLAFRDDDK